MSSGIALHCSGVGSIPMGLWAQSYKKKTEFLGASLMFRSPPKTINVKSDGLLVVVVVSLHVKTAVVEDCLVVGLRGIGR
jgi:hypothetical protein